MSVKTGTVDIDVMDLDMRSFSSFDDIGKYLKDQGKINDHAVITDITFYHDFGMHDEHDEVKIIVDWKKE